MIKIAYVPMSSDYTAPGDRRRFCGYSKKKKINIEKYDKNKSYDVIVISQNADLIYWANFEKKKTKIVFDFCDAYLFEDFSFRKIFRGLGKYLTKQNIHLNFSYENLIKKVCRNSDLIICTTEKQKKKLINYCKNVQIVLDMQEMDIYQNENIIFDNEKKNHEKLNIFWEGQAGNLNSFFKILNLLNDLLNKNLINLYFVTDKNYRYFSGIDLFQDTKKLLKKMFNESDNVYLYDWNINNLTKIANICDIGVIPVANPHKGMFANKPANKLHLMWRLGLPVLVSPTSAMILSSDISGINLVCHTNHDWAKYINFFIKNKEDINHIGNNLKKIVNKNFSDENELNKWNLAFKKINLIF